ncbi:MAG: MMPL family transporter [Myxococcales bacterium]|nr:MMPL family transporter [Myxococcales bacterium]
MKETRRDAIAGLSRFFRAISAWSYDHRWLVLIASFAVWGLGGYLAGSARIDNSFESFFDTDDPTYGAYQRFREDFESDEIAYIVYRATEGPWDIDVMRKIERLTKALEEEVPFAEEVTSLSNAEFMEGAPPDDILVYDLLADFPKNQEELFIIRDKVMKKPLYLSGLVSADAELGAIIIEMNRSSIDSVEEIRLDPEGGDGLDNLYPQVSFDAIEAVIQRPEYSGIEFFHTGDVAINATYNRVFIEKDLPLVLSLTVVVIAIGLGLVFRRAIGVIGPFMVVAFAMAISVAVIGILGWRIDFMFGLMPALLITVGVADSVHILSEFGLYQQRLGDRRKAIQETLYLVGPPCLLTSLTTAAGFLSLSFSPVKSVSHLAVYSAAGVLAAFLASITILVAFLSFGRRVPDTASSEKERAGAKGGRFSAAALHGVASFVIRFRNAILVVSALVFIASAWGISMMTVDSNFLNEFSERVPIRQTTRFVDDHMSGASSIIYLFDSGEPDGIKNPAVLREIERVQKVAEQNPLVTKTYSVVDFIKEINQSFHNGDPAYYRIPESQELIAQYLLVYELSGGAEVKDYVSIDYARTSLELRCKLAETSRLQGVVDGISAHLDAEPLNATTVSKTGVGALWLKFVEYITWSQIQGALLAFTVVSLMMILVFRSVKIGLLSMIPNLSPVLLVLGGMGWVGTPLDYYRLLIAPVAIGIAVDDTIHLMTRYHHEFLKARDYKKALYASMDGVGRAVFITSVLLVAGFLMNLFSLMDGQKSFGVLIAAVIATALIADFLLMPALILWLKPFGPEAPANSTAQGCFAYSESERRS